MENAQSQQENQSEFAQKEPFIYKSTLIKIGFIILSIFLLIGIVFIGFRVYQTIKESLKPESQVVTNPDTPLEPAKDEIQIFTYIKDGKAIWQSDINGTEKSRIKELPGSSPETFTSLSWKDIESLSYSKYNGKTSTVETINTKNKGILTELTNQEGKITDIEWAGSNYLAYSLISNDAKTQNFMFKAGTVINTLFSFSANTQNLRVNTRIIFSEEGGYVIFSSRRLELIDQEKNTFAEIPFIQVFQFNGTKVDQIENASDPMLLEKNKIAFIYDGYLSSKYIGQDDITKITTIEGYNPTISFDKDKFAYWSSTGGFSNALLVIYDTNLNYQRNVLRGVLLPVWISPNKVAGIKADNCLGTNCQLYQYQTNNLAIVETDVGKVIEVDQGRSIDSISYNKWYAN